MKIPLTPYGKNEMTLWGGALCLCIIGALFLYPAASIPFIIILIWLVSFFRDPERASPQDPKLILCPCDGVVVDICAVKDDRYLKGEAVRIGVFMSVFSVHVNRSPCAGTVQFVSKEKGGYLNAMRPDCPDKNFRQYVGLQRPDGRKIMFSQISGFVARRIVCAVAPGSSLKAGERFGMIKFGSRCEVYLPKSERYGIKAKIGDKTTAGVTILAELQS
ncbi:MAG TPA: phosphatidylserine decarboxylase [Candidatus Brocadiia bacterium]|nr:phosphatidylserine decarboxylase [Candidatus Brocadiia bacterium]